MNERKNSLYVYPVIGRFGLAHSLLAWGRAQVWARNYNAQPLAPDWFKLRIGPYLRGERDKRNYFRLFQSGSAIGGMRKRAMLATLRKLEEHDLEHSVLQANSTAGVVLFRSRVDNDIRAEFEALRGSSDFLRGELTAMTRPKYRPERTSEPKIALHVRLGDFGQATDEQLRGGMQNVRLPMSWYIETINSVRRALNSSIPVEVYSDGNEEELAQLFALTAIKRSAARDSITDMLSIADSTVLIGPGSGFSLWGSYLGGVPRISYPGQTLVSVLDDPAQEIGLEPGDDLPVEFAAALSNRLIEANRGVRD